MEKICQIKAGKYLLAVASSAIIETRGIESFLADKQNAEVPLILLASLFDQRIAAFPEPEGFIMEVKSSAGSQLLVVDSFSEKGITVDHLESLPLLYPDLTRSCCPQIVIHNDQPLLLLDIDGLETVLASSGDDFATISLASLCSHYSSKTEVEDTQSTRAVDEATFNIIVSWTMAEFLKRDNDTKSVICPDEKLLEVISSRDVQGVDDDILQEVINKTIQKCRKFHDRAMERLKQTSALVKS